MDNIQVLATQFGISEGNVKEFAQSIINGMKKDGVVDAFLLMDEETRITVIEAYGLHAVRKMQQFTNTYLSNPQAAESLRRTIRSMI